MLGGGVEAMAVVLRRLNERGFKSTAGWERGDQPLKIKNELSHHEKAS